MTAVSGDKRERLSRLLDDETGLLAKLEDLAKLQLRFLGEGEIDMLVALFNKRHGIIEELDGLHQETKVLMQSYMSVSGDDVEISGKYAEVVNRLKEFIENDGKLHDEMKRVSAEYSAEIKKLNKGRRGLEGYKFADTGHSGFLDKKM